MKQPVLSVVNYDAWERGYMPPSEHILIDQLAYRSARVVFSSDYGEKGAFWLVVRGESPKRLYKLLKDFLDAFPAEPTASPLSMPPDEPAPEQG